MGLGAIRDGHPRIQPLEASAASAWLSAIHFFRMAAGAILWMEPGVFVAVRELCRRRAICCDVVWYSSPSIWGAIRLAGRWDPGNNADCLDDFHESAHRQPRRRFVECSAFLLAGLSKQWS